MKKQHIVMLISVLILIFVCSCGDKTSTENEEKSSSGTATQFQDIKSCEKFGSDKKYRCYFEVAGAIKDPTECENMPYDYYKDVCYTAVAKHTKDTVYCDKVGFDFKSDCIGGVAEALKDIKICEQIKNSYQKETRCYNKVANATLNFGLCDKLQDEYLYDSLVTCYRDIAETKKDPADCEKFSLDLKDHCYWGIAKGTKNTAYCDKIVNIFLGDYNNSPLYRSLCINDVAKVANDIQICEEISHEGVKADCYESIAVIREDTSICNKLSNEPSSVPSRDSCLWKVAVKISDKTLCNEIKDSEIKKKCLSSFDKARKYIESYKSNR